MPRSDRPDPETTVSDPEPLSPETLQEVRDALAILPGGKWAVEDGGSDDGWMLVAEDCEPPGCYPHRVVARSGEWDHLQSLLVIVRNLPALLSAAAEAERRHNPIPDTYGCQRCGRKDGLDAVVPNDIWRVITEGEWANPDPATRRGEVVNGKWNLLCLWCIDELCGEHGVTCSASLHFCGRHITGRSDSDADREHISRLARDRDESAAEAERLRRENERLERKVALQRAVIENATRHATWLSNISYAVEHEDEADAVEDIFEAQAERTVLFRRGNDVRAEVADLMAKAAADDLWRNVPDLAEKAEWCRERVDTSAALSPSSPRPDQGDRE
jgi:hypothetical protein